MKSATSKTLRERAREYLRYWGVTDDAGADQENELIRVLRGAIAEDRAARDAELATGTARPLCLKCGGQENPPRSLPCSKCAAPTFMVARDAEHAADRASRGTQREAAFHEALSALSGVYMDTVGRPGVEACADVRRALHAVGKAIRDARDATPSPGEMVRREDVVRWLRAMSVDADDEHLRVQIRRALDRLVERLLDRDAFDGDLAALDAGKEGT